MADKPKEKDKKEEEEKKDTPPYSEYRQVHRGFRESLKIHLQTRLQPWRWPIMLKTGAIRIERRSKPVPNLTVEFEIESGDVIVIDDAYGATWRNLADEARRNFRDYVFCPQQAGDRFLQDQVAALLMEKTSKMVPLSHNNVDILDLYALIKNLIPLGDHPIRHLVIVTHASEYGDLLIRMRGDSVTPSATDPDNNNAKNVTWEGLQEALALGEKNPLLIHDATYLVNGRIPERRADGSRDNRFSKVLPRPERSDGKFVPCAVIIKGCSSGVHTIFLNKIRDAMGYMIDIVVMPKWFSATARRGKELVEYFQHDFEVTSIEPMSRKEIIEAFRKKKQLDWLGKQVPDPDWEDLVPKDVTSRDSAPMKQMDVRVAGRSDPLKLTTFFDSGTEGLGTRVMKVKEKPDAAAIQKFLIDALARTKLFDNGTGDWPIWKRMGIGSLKAFIARYVYELDPEKKSGPDNWHVHARRHYYQVRTPLLENGTLVANYYPGRDGAEPTRLLDYNDNRLFGRSDPRPKDKEYPDVGKNFSRSL